MDAAETHPPPGGEVDLQRYGRELAFVSMDGGIVKVRLAWSPLPWRGPEAGRPPIGHDPWPSITLKKWLVHFPPQSGQLHKSGD